MQKAATPNFQLNHTEVSKLVHSIKYSELKILKLKWGHEEYGECFLGNDLVDVIVMCTKLSGEEARGIGAQIGQYLVDAGWIRNVLEGHPIFKDRKIFYQFCCKQEHDSRGCDTLGKQLLALKPREVMEIVIKCPALLDQFSHFLKKRFAEENLNFLLSVHRYENRFSDESRRGAAKSIFKEFIDRSYAVQHLNITEELFKDLESKFNSAVVTSNVFDEVKQHVFDLIKVPLMEFVYDNVEKHKKEDELYMIRGTPKSENAEHPHVEKKATSHRRKKNRIRSTSIEEHPPRESSESHENESEATSPFTKSREKGKSFKDKLLFVSPRLFPKKETSNTEEEPKSDAEKLKKSIHFQPFKEHVVISGSQLVEQLISAKYCSNRAQATEICTKICGTPFLVPYHEDTPNFADTPLAIYRLFKFPFFDSETDEKSLESDSLSARSTRPRSVSLELKNTTIQRHSNPHPPSNLLSQSSNIPIEKPETTQAKSPSSSSLMLGSHSTSTSPCTSPHIPPKNQKSKKFKSPRSTEPTPRTSKISGHPLGSEVSEGNIPEVRKHQRLEIEPDPPLIRTHSVPEQPWDPSELLDLKKKSQESLFKVQEAKTKKKKNSQTKLRSKKLRQELLPLEKRVIMNNNMLNIVLPNQRSITFHSTADQTISSVIHKILSDAFLKEFCVLTDKEGNTINADASVSQLDLPLCVLKFI